MAELLKSDDYGRNWYIVTKVERIRGNEVKEISSSSVSNEDDRKLEITDNDMKAGDKYRITKTLFEKNATNIDDKLVELITTVDANVKKEEQKVEDKKDVKPAEQSKVEEKPQVTPEQPKSEENTQTPAVEQPSNSTNDDNHDAKLSNLKDTLVAKLPGDEEVTVKFKAKDVTGIHFVAQNSNEQKVNEVKELVKNLDENLNVVKTLDLFFTDDNGNVINKNGETKVVTVAVLAKDNETLEVYYVNGDKLEKVPSTYSDGKLTFYTDHFSTYTIVSRTNNNTNVGNNPISQRFNNILPKTGLTENSVGALLVGILGIVLAALGFRRKR